MNFHSSGIRQQVLEGIVPKEEERKKVYDLSERLLKSVSKAANKASLKSDINLEGSVAKDTWLKGDADIDIFIRVDADLSRRELETTCLAVAKDAIKGNKAIERFSEHPYIETKIGGSTVNIVPCYNVERGMWKSATDRTPYHTKYMNDRLTTELRNEIRLLKRFMMGAGTYGAEIKVGGFSGMLCETLTLAYRSFEETLRAAARWRNGTIIDVENQFGGDHEEVHDLFEQPLIVIDPIDKARNVAAAVRPERLWEFVSSARAFLKKPTIEFFYPSKKKKISRSQFVDALKQRQTSLLGLWFGDIRAPVDVLWSQIYKTEKSIVNLMHSKGFSVLRSASFSDERDLNVIVLEVEKQKLPKTMKRLGPHVERISESERFLSAHLVTHDTVSGPWIEGDRWAVQKLRRYTDAKKLWDEFLKDGGRNIGVSGLVAESVRKKYRILADQQLGKLLINREFGDFITKFLDGRPHWLR